MRKQMLALGAVVALAASARADLPAGLPRELTSGTYTISSSFSYAAPANESASRWRRARR